MTFNGNQDGLRILICDPVDSALTDGLEKKGYKVDMEPQITPDTLKERITGYDAVVVRSRTKLTSEVLSHADNLKIIARAGVGTDNIDTAKAKALGIKVITAAGSSTQSVVELNVALMVDLARGITRLNSQVRKGNYKKQAGVEAYGKTAGIIGFGRIGFETARVLKVLGMDILAYDLYENHDAMNQVGGKFVPLKELLQKSDYVFILITMDNGATHILGKEEFASMKEGIRLVNTSRAEAVDPEELFSALESGKVAGYGSDVLWHEPPSTELEKKLIEMDNVVITPHIGAQTKEAQKRVAAVTLENLLNALEGAA